MTSAAQQAIAPQDRDAFPTLDAEDLDQLRLFATCQSYAAGAVVLGAGEADVDLIVVEHGSLEVRNPADGGAVIAVHGPGQFAGDIDLLTRRPIVFEAVAIGDGLGGPTRVVRVPNEQLRLVLNAVPRVSDKLMVALQARRQSLARAGLAGVRVVGPAGSGRTNAVREFLHKNFVPFTWTDSAGPDGRALLERLGSTDAVPAVDCGGGRVLRRPTLREVATATGVWRGCPGETVDLAVVGAGPAGLAAAVYAASEGLKTVVIDAVGPGGQAGGSSKIENFIGFPSGLSGTDLATRGVLQMLKFGATLVAPVTVDRFVAATDGGSPHELHLDCAAVLKARVVLAATGVRWRRLAADGAERFERSGVYYACTMVEALLHIRQDVAVVGGGNSAGQAVMYLADSFRGRTVHLVVRRSLTATMSEYLTHRIRGAANVNVHEGFEVSAVHGDHGVRAIDLNPVPGCCGKQTRLPCGAVFVFIGAEPHADWLPAGVACDPQGYVLTGTDLAKTGRWPVADRDPCALETTIPRLLAGGDLRAGSTKRVGFAVGDGSLAVTSAHRLLPTMSC
jgi:thioredoxin reductase (NADPH)